MNLIQRDSERRRFRDDDRLDIEANPQLVRRWHLHGTRGDDELRRGFRLGSWSDGNRPGSRLGRWCGVVEGRRVGEEHRGGEHRRTADGEGADPRRGSPGAGTAWHGRHPQHGGGSQDQPDTRDFLHSATPFAVGNPFPLGGERYPAVRFGESPVPHAFGAGETSFNPMIDPISIARNSNRPTVAGSRNQRMPTTAVPAAPMPVQTA